MFMMDWNTISDYSENKKRNWEEYLKKENLEDTINLNFKKIKLIIMIM